MTVPVTVAVTVALVRVRLLRRQVTHTADAAKRIICTTATAGTGARLHGFVMLRVTIRGGLLRLILVLLMLLLVGVRWLVVLLLLRRLL